MSHDRGFLHEGYRGELVISYSLEEGWKWGAEKTLLDVLKLILLMRYRVDIEGRIVYADCRVVFRPLDDGSMQIACCIVSVFCWVDWQPP